MERTKMEMDKLTGKVGYIGTVSNPIEVEVVEVEVEGGFRLEGTTAEGQKIVAELSVEDYFEGKFFVAGKLIQAPATAEEEEVEVAEAKAELITPEYWSATKLMEYQAKLEWSKSPTIHHFMVNEICFDFDKNPVWVELAQLLEATMERKNGWWVDKDII